MARFVTRRFAGCSMRGLSRALLGFHTRALNSTFTRSRSLRQRSADCGVSDHSVQHYTHSRDPQSTTTTGKKWSVASSPLQEGRLDCAVRLPCIYECVMGNQLSNNSIAFEAFASASLQIIVSDGFSGTFSLNRTVLVGSWYFFTNQSSPASR